MNRRKMITGFIFLTVSLVFVLEGWCETKKKIPWHQRHFPNVPRISAEAALKLRLSGQKTIVIDVPWSTKGFNNAHICGAVPTKATAAQLDKLIKKIPKDYIILSYCK